VRLGPEAEVTYRGVIGQKLLLLPLSCREFLAAIITKTRLLLSPVLACFFQPHVRQASVAIVPPAAASSSLLTSICVAVRREAACDLRPRPATATCDCD
jgi:hypothetical protein